MSTRKRWNGSRSSDLFHLFSEDVIWIFFRDRLREQEDGGTTFYGALYMLALRAVCKDFWSYAGSMNYVYDEEQIRIADFKLFLREINTPLNSYGFAVLTNNTISYGALVRLKKFQIGRLLEFLAKKPVKKHGKKTFMRESGFYTVFGQGAVKDFHIHSTLTRTNESAPWDVSMIIYSHTANYHFDWKNNDVTRYYKRLV